MDWDPKRSSKKVRRPTPPRRRHWNGEDDARFERIRRPPAIHVAARTGDAREASVVGVVAGGCVVQLGSERIPAIGAVTDVVVGDVVRIVPGPTGKVVVRDRLPRRTVLSRPHPDNPRLEHAIAANVDRAVIVVSTRSPPLRTGLVDRFLVAIERGGVEPVLCVNKVDLVEASERVDVAARLSPYVALGMPVVSCSASTCEGLESLRREISGRTVVFVGHSGVGKSSLTNALAPDAHRDVGAVRAFDGKGRHTSTSSALVTLEDGTRLVDTPGIRSFGLWRIDRGILRSYFPEFASAPACRFRDCSHIAEPDCGVRRAVESGEISPPRYQAFLRLQSEE